MSHGNIGVGPPPGVQGSSKRFVSPDNQHVLQVEEKNEPPGKKRKVSSVLTPDNAAAVLGGAFDLQMFSAILAQDQTIVQNPKELFDLMTRCVIDQTILPFTSVAQRHLKVLGLDTTYRMSLNSERVASANHPDSPSNAILPDTLVHMRKHFNVSKESGCRCIIDQYLLAAVIYAQKTIDADPQLKADLRKTYRITKPHIAVFTELNVPHTQITCGEVTYTFHGILDYGIGFVSADDIPSLGRGTLSLDAHDTLSGILEAKSLSEMKDAVPQITTQVLTVLILTGRTSFTGALTSGALWRFFTAYKTKESRLKIYMSTELAAETDNGVIIELLKDMILFTKSPMVDTDFEEEEIY